MEIVIIIKDSFRWEIRCIKWDPWTWNMLQPQPWKLLSAHLTKYASSSRHLLRVLDIFTYGLYLSPRPQFVSSVVWNLAGRVECECLECVCVYVCTKAARLPSGEAGGLMNRNSSRQVWSSDSGRAARYGANAGGDNAGDGVGIL